MTFAAVCRDLHFAYPPVLTNGPEIQVFVGLDLAVTTGECLGVIGPNGAGKSTLLLILAGLAPHMTGGRLTGDVAVTGRAGMVFQESEGQLFNPTVEAEIAWGLENLGLPPQQITERVEWALDAVGIAALRRRSPGMLSGGQQKRVAIAAALAMRPDILLLDEPSGGLDPDGRAEVLTVLAQLKQSYPVTVIMAENEADTVAEFADRIVVIHKGVVAREGLARDVFRDTEWLDEIGAPVPPAARLAAQLRVRWPHLDFVNIADAQVQLAALPSPEGDKR